MKRTNNEIECQFCKGTGLDTSSRIAVEGAAFVCPYCKGTGKAQDTLFLNREYHSFEGRKEAEGVTRVFESSLGYVHAGKDITVGGRLVHFSRYGCTYEEWKAGVKPTPVEELYCPNQYRYRGKGEEPIERCKNGYGVGCLPYNCKFFSDKAKCWEEWHKEND